MIKLTISEILNAAPVLTKLTNQTFSGAATFKIARLLKALDKEITIFEETRTKMVQDYGEKDEKGVLIEKDGNIHVMPDKIETFNNEINALLKSEVEINSEKLSIDYFENIELTPMEASLIEVVVE